MITIKSIVDLLSGKKTYIIAGLMIVLGILQKDQNLVLQGLAVMSGRAAIAKMTPAA